MDDPARILALLEQARALAVVFHRGLDAQIDLEVATLVRVEGDRLILRADNFEDHRGSQIFLNFYLSGRPYFFSTRPLTPIDDGRLAVEIPASIFYSERRDRVRSDSAGSGGGHRVVLTLSDGRAVPGELLDTSPGGMSVLIPADVVGKQTAPLVVRHLDGDQRGSEERLFLRNQQPAREREGWNRLGLVRAEGTAPSLIREERRSSMLDPQAAHPVAGQWQTPGSSAGDEDYEPRVVRIQNSEGEELVALLDSWGDSKSAPVILIPPGWGQTKEALLPLARTLISCFKAWNLPINVLRFDGIRQRGESHNDSICKLPGREYHHFTFSQGVRDIEAWLDYLETSPVFTPAQTLLVTFSIAAIAGRRAVANDGGRRIAGWLSVVGSPDLLSAIRSISGGVDLAAGYEQGLRFGIQELLGVAVDSDRIGEDANQHKMVFIEDSRRDLARIHVPVSWFHGEYDAWMDLDRVRDVLSHGDPHNRRLITIPMGHQVRTSRQALETFQCLAAEAGRILFPERDPESLATSSPDPKEVRRRWMAEGRRRHTTPIDLRSFWRDYLLGRDRSLGIELMTNGAAYREMMQHQIDALSLSSGDCVADLGCGTGAFALNLASSEKRPELLEIRHFDYVAEALARARSRHDETPRLRGIESSYAQCDLNLLNADQRIPAADRSFDAVIASLLLSYLDYPVLVLRDMYRTLKPGGRLVISSLCRDADISRLYHETYAEVQIAGRVAHLPEAGGKNLPSLARNFLNDAAKILELEEAGAFQLWDPDELSELVLRAGFSRIETQRAFGDPPQGVVLRAVKE
jgi:ubiquinone/menaquinone biosynthesis C-methylase UbiE